ncbi:MAG: SOS response-associated peptidase [Candidatus Cloacimonetes bacterium]|nr:SOS response-associated peptidase [Candidatus Cloacimonadota bacterium]MDY0367987.1 SOS response-associated peptidase [Candidatus Syntrophosphaera sp.]
MCGRFAFFVKGQFGYESLQLSEPPRFERYNIAPSQEILAIRTAPEAGRPEWVMLRWGLVPFWSKEPGGKRPLINARAEGIEAKPSFRGPVRHRRCIVPASGFYEWGRQGTGKQPYFVRPAKEEVFALAGIWDHWEGKQGEVIESVAIITTSANELVQPIHDRMPVILEEEDVAEWIATATKLEKALAMLKPCSSARLVAYPVSSLVNSARHDGPECLARVSQMLPGQL